MYDKKIETKVDKVLGYLYFTDKDHPLANKSGKVYYHRHIASLKVGRWLEREEYVHHIDYDKKNNSFDNLKILSASEHCRIHIRTGLLKDVPEVIPHPCKVCEKLTKEKIYCSHKCAQLGSRKVKNRPPLKEVKKLLKTNSYLEVGRIYGVSDNAVRKWFKNAGEKPPKKNLKK